MQIEDDRNSTASALAQIQVPGEADSGSVDVRIQLATLLARLSGLESDLTAIKTGMAIIESRLTGIENRQRHTEERRERIETRFSDFDFGVDRVNADMATLKDRVRCVELDLRELSGNFYRRSKPASAGDAQSPLGRVLSSPVSFKSS